jgi:hypothetical protein
MYEVITAMDLGFVFFIPYVVFQFLPCKVKDSITSIDCFMCFVCFSFLFTQLIV